MSLYTVLYTVLIFLYITCSIFTINLCNNNKLTLGQIMILPLLNCVTLDKLTSLCFKFVIWKSESCTYSMGLFWGLNELIHVKHLEEYLAHNNSQHVLTACYYLQYIWGNGWETSGNWKISYHYRRWDSNADLFHS